MRIASISAALLAAALTLPWSGPTPLLAADSQAASTQTVAMRRISPDQYRQIITDVFGADIRIGGRFEPDRRDSGLLAVGAAKVSVTETGLQQYDGMARSVAAQVVKNRSVFPCKPAAERTPDDACAAKFLAPVGQLLYRRPMTDSELKAHVGAANAAALKLRNFYDGVELSLAAMLASPQFLFRREVAEPDPAKPGQYRINAYSKASKLSFLLWNSAPDLLLLEAAESGDLDTPKGYARQVDRMLASPRLEAGARAFFTDMFAFDDFELLAKDAKIYPQFSLEVNRDAAEETLRTVIDLLITRRGDYRSIFTTKKTFLTPALASVYVVPLVRTNLANGEPEPWMPFEYPADDPRAGILMHVSFVALHSHAGRSSPTIRGKALREIMLCQKVPDPPGNVNFTVVQDTSNPTYKTARERLNAHATEAMCTGCHKLTDPLGLALENLDGGGGFRKHENGAPIDTSGIMDGVKFMNGAELGKVVHDNPAATGCVVNRLASYALGGPANAANSDWLRKLGENFAKDGYRIPDLMRRIVTSDEFMRVSMTKTAARTDSNNGRQQ